MVYVFDDLKHVIYAKIIKKNKLKKMLFPHTKSNVLWIVRSGLMNAQTESDTKP